MLTIVPLIARCLLAAIFIQSGYAKAMGLGGTAAYIAQQGLPAPQVLAIATAACELLGGVALVLGFQARLIGLAFAVFCIGTAFVFHGGPSDVNFMKNLSIAGGMLMVFAFGPGRISLDRR